MNSSKINPAINIEVLQWWFIFILSTDLWGKFKMLMDLYWGEEIVPMSRTPSDNVVFWQLCCVCSSTTSGKIRPLPATLGPGAY